MLKKISTYCTLLILILHPIITRAQEPNILYTLGNTPQSNLLNPARVTDQAKVAIQLPLISGFGFSLNNSFPMSSFIGIHDTTLTLDFNKLQSKIGFASHFTQQINLPLLGLQLRLGKNMFTASVTEKQLFRLSFDRNLAQLINEGNEAFINQPFTTHFDMIFFHYREYSLGYGCRIDKRWSVGARAKLLTGFSTVDVRKMNIGLTTGQNFEYLTLSAQGEYNMSLPFNVEKNDEEQIPFDVVGYFTNTSNPGMAFDLGASFRIMPELEVSASIIDLGFIRWKDNVTNISHDGSFRWQGLNLNSFISTPEPVDGENVPNPNPINELTDSISKLTDLQYASNPFTTGLPTKIFLAGEYAFHPVISVSLVDRLFIYDTQVANSFTLSGNMKLGQIWALSAGYSVIGRSFNNLSIGTSLKLGPFELWAATNNILALQIRETSNFNLIFGINLMFGKNEPFSL
jgi:hypothetical protein